MRGHLFIIDGGKIPNHRGHRDYRGKPATDLHGSAGLWKGGVIADVAEKPGGGRRKIQWLGSVKFTVIWVWISMG